MRLRTLFRIVLVAGCTAMCSQRLSAQAGGSAPPTDDPIVFTGNSLISSQYSDRPGTFQTVPAKFWRWELNPAIQLFGIPFGVNVLLSSEQSTIRQNINSAGLTLDIGTDKLEQNIRQKAADKLQALEQLKAQKESMGIDALRDSLARNAPASLLDLPLVEDIDKLRALQSGPISGENTEDLQKFGLLTKTQKFFLDFPALGIGTVQPHYTVLTMDGIEMNGANIEYNPGNLYVAISGGQAQRAIPGVIEVDTTQLGITQTLVPQSFSREVYMARLGYGRKSGGHCYLTALYGHDIQGSVPAADSLTQLALDSSGQHVYPVANALFGVEAQIPVIQDVLLLNAEASGSMFTTDLNGPRHEIDGLPGFLDGLLKPRLTSTIDYALLGKATLTIAETDTRVEAGARYLGPGFFSLGAPNLRNDNLRFDLKANQSLLEHQVTVGGFLRSQTDNLIAMKASTTNVLSFGINLSLNFRDLPYLRLSYSPNAQKSLHDTTIDNYNSVLSATLGYSAYFANGINSNTNIMFNRQQSGTGAVPAFNSVQTYTLNQTFSFAFPLSVSASATLNQSVNLGIAANDLWTFEATATHTAFDIWTNSAGVTLNKQSGVDDKTGFYVATALPLSALFNLQVRAEKNIYANQLFNATNYNEFVLRASLQSSW